MLKVLAYTGGTKQPSRVFRVRQYIPSLEQLGIRVTESRSWTGTHPPDQKWLRPLWGMANLGERGPDALKSLAYDLVFFQRELLSTFVTWEPYTRRPRVFDVDDAIWVHPRGDFARKLAQICDHVICGNQFLAEKFSVWNKNVSILPTPVDVHVFAPRQPNGDPSRKLVIGWMGLSSNLRLLYPIERALREVLRRHPEAVFRVVSSARPQLKSLPAEQVEFVPWSAETEAQSIQEMTIGIMPLDDDVYARGKCSYKMLLYMACGLPVVVSPVGMNIEVLAQGTIGFPAQTEDEWADRLDDLLHDCELRNRLGRAGREVVACHYSVEALVPRLAKTLLSVAGVLTK